MDIGWRSLQTIASKPSHLRGHAIVLFTCASCVQAYKRVQNPETNNQKPQRVDIDKYIDT